MKCGKQNISQEERNNVNVVNVDTDSKPDQKVLFKDVIKCCYENITRFSRTKIYIFQNAFIQTMVVFTIEKSTTKNLGMGKHFACIFLKSHMKTKHTRTTNKKNAMVKCATYN
jgi:hypothetical protein